MEIKEDVVEEVVEEAIAEVETEVDIILEEDITQEEVNLLIINHLLIFFILNRLMLSFLCASNATSIVPLFHCMPLNKAVVAPG